MGESINACCAGLGTSVESLSRSEIRGGKPTIACCVGACFKGNVGETSERQGGAHMGFSERIDIVLN